MQKKNVLVTGGAGFIGSNLVESLISDDRVGFIRILDNLSTGKFENIEPFLESPKVQFIQGDIRNFETLLEAMDDIHVISHQAALGSVPRSIKDPITTNEVNIGGTLNVMFAAVESGIDRVVYAASSSTYGDSQKLPKVEGNEGNPLSPYAVTKVVSELYADVFQKTYGLNTIGLRYFNVFGPKQDPFGAYAAVIPLFVTGIVEGKEIFINGDGETSRDFTYIDNVVQINKLALFTENEDALNEVYNVAVGDRTTLNELVDSIAKVEGLQPNVTYREERKGDVRHSLADVSKAKSKLGYDPGVSMREGIKKVYFWYKENLVK